MLNVAVVLGGIRETKLAERIENNFVISCLSMQ
jgi:hypothetical protein